MAPNCLLPWRNPWSSRFERPAPQRGWRARPPPPPLPPETGTLSHRLSRPVHALLYVLLFVIPVFGIVTFIWHGRVFDFGLFKIDFGVRKNPAIFHPTEDIHGYLAYALFTLAGIHIAAA